MDNNQNQDLDIHNNRRELLSKMADGVDVSIDLDNTAPTDTAPVHETIDAADVVINAEDPDVGDPVVKPIPVGRRWDIQGDIVLEEPSFHPPRESKPINELNDLEVYDRISRPAYIHTTETDLNDLGTADAMTALAETAEESIPNTVYLSALNTAYQTLYPGDGLMSALSRPHAKWRQYIPIPNQKLRVSPRYNNNIRKTMKPGEMLIGDRAMEMFLANNRDFRSVQIPLYNTGIWIKMAPPSISYLIEIDRTLALLKSDIGLNTNGMVNSNEDVLFNEVLVDAALKLITHSNYPVSNTMQLKNIIRSNDIETLIWGMALGAYGTGYDVNIPCTNAASCRHVSEFRAAPNRMRVVDTSRFTPAQIDHMAKGITHQVTDKELDDYQAEFDITNRDSATFMYKQTYEEGLGDKFRFRVSTVSQYFEFANLWFAKITEALKESMGNSYHNPKDRIEALDDTLDIEDLCRYGHVIESIEVRHSDDTLEGGIIEDTNTIRSILKQLASDPKGMERLRTAIEDFIQDTVTVIYGTENIPCPECGQYRLVNGKQPMVVPFKVNVGFFILYQHRLLLAGKEPMASLMTLGQVLSDQPTTAEEFMNSLENEA